MRTGSGYLVGETLRRATGHTISELLRDLITSPLGIEDEVHFGVPARLLPQVATQIDPEGIPEPPEATRATPVVITPGLPWRTAVICPVPTSPRWAR